MDQVNCLNQLYKAFLDSDLLLTDSRIVQREVELGKRVLFIALKGDNFDANDFVEQVIDSGASYILTSRESLANGENILYTRDPLDMLQQLSALHRTKMGCKLVAITGSNGKTTTKELLVAALSKKFKVAYTKGNFNNHIGLPLTLLSISSDDDVAVVEHGANHIGEIAHLTTLSKPDIGLITNIGKAHIGEFNGVEGIIKAKGELYDSLMNSGGVAIVNSSLAHLSEMAESRAGVLNTVFYDISDFSEQSNSGEYLSYNWHGRVIQTNLIGSYNLYNIAAATAIATYLGVDDTTISESIGSYKPQNMRSQLVKTARNSIVVDAYNANPSSMMVSIDNFEHKTKNGVYLLGDMQELGDYSDIEHNILAKRLSQIDSSKVVLVGKNFEMSAKSYGLTWFENVKKLIDSDILSSISNSTILLKGSRSNAMEKCIEQL